MPNGPAPRLEDIMPTWHWRSRHTIILESPADRVFTTIGGLVVSDLPRAAGRRPGRLPVRIVDDLLRQGFRLFREQEPEGYVLGRIGRFWSRNERSVAPDAARNDPEWFARFEAPGFAKAALGLTCVALQGDTATLLVAETRVQATDEASHQEFNRHWLVNNWANPYPLEELVRTVKAHLAP